MPDSDEDPPLSSNDSQSAESRMRRALGLQGTARQAPQQRADPARPRHRFAQDGSVPVVVLSSRGDNDPAASFRARIAELETALEAERNVHGITKRALHEAQTGVQALRTRLAHTELAHGETLAAERRLRKEVEDALQARLAPKAEQPPPIATLPRLIAADRPKAARKAPHVLHAAKNPEPQPVKWWLPGYREKTR